jgi:hypothetical protein
MPQLFRNVFISPQTNFGTLSEIYPRPNPLISFPSHYLLNILLFYSQQIAQEVLFVFMRFSFRISDGTLAIKPIFFVV